jgi:hypothetical protein
MGRSFSSAEPHQRPVLGENGIHRPITRRLAPSRLMGRAFRSAEPRQRPVLGRDAHHSTIQLVN